MISIDNLLAAAVKYTPMTDLPFLDETVLNGANGATGMFNSLFTLSIVIGAMLAVFMFIWGGLQMITARDSSGSVGAGKTKMTNAVMGLLMLVSTYVVLDTINPQLTSLTLFGNVTPLTAAPQVAPRATVAERYGADMNDESDKSIVCTGIITPYGVNPSATAEEVAFCKNFKNTQAVQIQELRQKLSGTEDRFCPDGIFRVADTGCYNDPERCKLDGHVSECTKRPISKSLPIEDGRHFLANQQFGTEHYQTEDACELARMIQASAGLGYGAACTQ